MAENTTKVLVRNLCKSFGELEVLKDCNFQIEKGEFVCVVGPYVCSKKYFILRAGAISHFNVCI